MSRERIIKGRRRPFFNLKDWNLQESRRVGPYAIACKPGQEDFDWTPQPIKPGLVYSRRNRSGERRVMRKPYKLP